MPQTMIELREVSKHFQQPVLRQVSFAVLQQVLRRLDRNRLFESQVR